MKTNIFILAVLSLALIVVIAFLSSHSLLASEYTFNNALTKCVEINSEEQENLSNAFNKKQVNDLGKDGKVYEYGNKDIVIYSYTNRDICSLALKEGEKIGIKMHPEYSALPPKSYTSRSDFVRAINFMLWSDPILKKNTTNMTEAEIQKIKNYCADLAFSKNQQSLKEKIDELADLFEPMHLHNKETISAVQAKYGLNEVTIPPKTLPVETSQEVV